MQVSIQLKEEFTKASNWPPAIAKGLPFMIQAAMTEGSQKVTKALSAQLKKKLKNPIPRTANAAAVVPKKISTNNLSVTMFLKGAGPKDGPGGTRGQPGNYLQPLIKGGGRPQKRSELRLRQYIIPVEAQDTVIDGFKLNKYGNLPAGKYTQVLSRVKAFNTAGFNANVSGAKRSQLKKSKSDFYIGMANGKLGIQGRVGNRPKGNPGGIGRPVTSNLPRGFTTAFYFVRQPQYRRILPIGTILSKSFETNYTKEFNKQIKEKINRLIQKYS